MWSSNIKTYEIRFGCKLTVGSVKIRGIQTWNPAKYSYAVKTFGMANKTICSREKTNTFPSPRKRNKETRYKNLKTTTIRIYFGQFIRGLNWTGSVIPRQRPLSNRTVSGRVSEKTRNSKHARVNQLWPGKTRKSQRTLVFGLTPCKSRS